MVKFSLTFPHSAITALELLLCVKYGAAVFKRTDVNFVLIILWIVVQVTCNIFIRLSSHTQIYCICYKQDA